MGLQEQLAPLKEKLQKAVELEWATIPPYLTALYSIQPGKNAMAASIIRSIAMEEMLHLLLAGNLLSSIGGSVRLGRDNMPEYPLQLEFKGQKFKNRLFDISLAAFSKDTIEIFLQIELPDGWNQGPIPFDHIEVPGYTVGEFYRGIKNDLADICQAFGEKNVFTGRKSNQVSEEYFWKGGGTPIVVTNLFEAEKAIDLIIEQGEGTSESAAVEAFHFFNTEEVPHYFRFNEIYYGQLYNKTDDPHKPPTGLVIEVDYKGVLPIKTNCKSSDLLQFSDLSYLNNLFNTNYSTMLSQLEKGFNGNPSAFYTAILNGMRKLSAVATNLMQLPIPNVGKNAAPSFEWNEM